ncbi:MAG TPA: quercetin 2,3-dioxygenase [Gaiellaceae bacterium]|jgi:mannose-6-phosphate isomerase-like protein (cupin superfamily)
MHVETGAGEAVWFTDNRMTVKATAEETGGSFGLVEGLGRPGSSPALHVHSREDEGFWLLEGQLTVRCGERTFTARPGSFTFLPRGVPHTFVVEGDTPARLLSVCVPGGFEQFFVAAGRPAESDGLPPQGPPDVERLRQVGEEYGVSFVGPPLAPTRT